MIEVSESAQNTLSFFPTPTKVQANCEPIYGLPNQCLNFTEFGSDL